MAKGDAFWNRRRRMIIFRDRLKDENVADNQNVRTEIMQRVASGEITLNEAKAELKKIKREAAKKNKETLF